MASIRIPALRHLATCLLRAPPGFRRWARVHDVRFIATTLPSRAVMDRYRSKLEEKALHEGHGSVDSLRSAYADKLKAQRRRDAPGAALPDTPASPPPRPPHSGSPAAAALEASRAGAAKPVVKALNDILDLEKARKLPDRELTAIWRLHHASSPQNICAVIPAATYQAMEDVAHRSPQFVLPLPHESQGAEIHFLQWTFDAASKTSTVLFTHLAEYKSKGEFAQPHTTITHHTDLSSDKGLVLMQGQIMDGRGVQPEHAKWLVMCLQRFYGAWDGGEGELVGERSERAEVRKKLLEWFSNGDSRFSVEKLLEEAERMG